MHIFPRPKSPKTTLLPPVVPHQAEPRPLLSKGTPDYWKHLSSAGKVDGCFHVA